MAGLTLRKGGLFVISAPSGAGKTTLCKRLLTELPGVGFSVSYTTRAPRAGEVDGVDYFFVERGEFVKMAEAGEFVEWAEVHGNFYGTSKRHIEETLAAGMDIILDIDTQGAALVREKSGLRACYIFILPPSMEELRRRLSGRGTNTPEDMARRLENAVGEIRDYKLYNYVIVNDDIEEALVSLKSVILAGRSEIGCADHAEIERIFLTAQEA